MDRETTVILEAYWKKTLKPPLTPPDVLALTQPLPSDSNDAHTIETVVPKETVTHLQKMSKNSDTALFILVLSALNVVWSRYLNCNDVIMLTPLPLNRATIPNTVYCRSIIDRTSTLKDTIIRTRQIVQDAFDYGAYPISQLAELFKDWSNTAFWMDGFQDPRALPEDNLALTVSFHTDPGCIKMNWQPNTGFSAPLMKSFSNNLVHFLGSISDNLDVPLCRADILDPVEKERLIYRFNDTALEYPVEKTLDQLLEERAQCSPDAVAVRDFNPGVQMTYRRLKEVSQHIARMLGENSIAAGDIVAIMTDRSAMMIAAIYGILRIGAAYLPIDPDYPKDRIDYILKDSNARLLIDDSFLNSLFPENASSSEAIVTEKDSFHARSASAIAYVIYTSGSTGKPKGVAISHRNVVNFINGINQIIPFRDNHVILCLTTISFDIFGLETLLPLSQGSRVIMGGPREQFNGDAAAVQLIRESVTHLQVTPSRLELLLAAPRAQDALATLDTLMVGGEAFPVPLLERVRTVTSCKLFNMYGPTETTIWSSVKDLSGALPLNIGTPIANTQIRILDKYNNDLPLGGVGELCIGGDGVGLGYLNKPELTAQRFSPFLRPAAETRTGKAAYVLYKTGDLARWLPDGNIECLGRTDFQVKIRGFRIELGEIERVLLSHVDIQAAVVAAKQDAAGHSYLCAYIVPNAESRPAADSIKAHLSAQLPDYMIPSHIAFLSTIPLTPNGKVDRKALPDPDLSGSAAYITPRDELEKQLAEIWAGAVNIPVSRIGIDHNFYDLGGHSLTAAAISAELFNRLKYDISPGDMLKTPTIRGLSEIIRQTGSVSQSRPPLEAQEDREYYPVSAAQIRLYIQQQKNPGSVQYNMTLAYQVNGTPDPQKIQQVFQRLLGRHEPLRTSFFMLDHNVVQKVSPPPHTQFAMTTGICKGNDGQEENTVIREELRRFIRPFVLSDAPLMRVHWMETENRPDQSYLFFDIHHIISDGLSMQMLMEEFALLYDEQSLQPMNIQYRDYVLWYQRHLQKTAIEQGEHYWLNRLDGFTFSRVTPDISGAYAGLKGGMERIALDPDLFDRMDRFCKSHQITRFTLLCSILALVVSQETGNTDITLGTPVSNRSHPYLKRLLGLFLSVVLVRFNLAENKPFLDQLHHNKQVIDDALENSGYELDTLAARLTETKGVKADELFSILFNYLPPRTRIEDHEGELTFRPVTAGQSAPRFDITFYVIDRGDSLSINAEYKANLYYPQTIAHMLTQMTVLLQHILDNEHISVSQLIKPVSSGKPEDENDFSAGFNDDFLT